MKKIIFAWILVLCIGTGCSAEKADMETKTGMVVSAETEAFFAETTGKIEAVSAEEIKAISVETTEEVGTEAEETKGPEELFAEFGIPVLLASNSNWMKHVEYHKTSDRSLEVCYDDDILGGACKLTVVRDGDWDLPEYDYEDSLEETWGGTTVLGTWIDVRVRHSSDGTVVAADWEYGDYKFVLVGNVPDSKTDTNPVPKAALSVISKLE